MPVKWVQLSIVGEHANGVATLTHSLIVPEKVKRGTILLSGIYPKINKNIYSHETCTWMFIVALFVITKIWKQPKYPLTGEWINKWWYIYTMGCYSGIKMEQTSDKCKKVDEFLMHSAMRRNPNWIGYMLMPFFDILKKTKAYIEKIDQRLLRTGGEGRHWLQRDKKHVLGNGIVLYLNVVMFMSMEVFV